MLYVAVWKRKSKAVHHEVQALPSCVQGAASCTVPRKAATPGAQLQTFLQDRRQNS